MTDNEIRELRQQMANDLRLHAKHWNALAEMAGRTALALEARSRALAPAPAGIPPASPSPAGHPAGDRTFFGAPGVQHQTLAPSQYAETAPPARFQPPSRLPAPPPLPADMAAAPPASSAPASAGGWEVRELAQAERNRFGYDYPQSEAPAWIAQGNGFFFYGPTRESVISQARAQGANL